MDDIFRAQIWSTNCLYRSKSWNSVSLEKDQFPSSSASRMRIAMYIALSTIWALDLMCIHHAHARTRMRDVRDGGWQATAWREERPLGRGIISRLGHTRGEQSAVGDERVTGRCFINRGLCTSKQWHLGRRRRMKTARAIGEETGVRRTSRSEVLPLRRDRVLVLLREGMDHRVQWKKAQPRLLSD